MAELSGKKVLVVGASRGLGRGIAQAFSSAGAQVIAVARDGARLAELAGPESGIVAEVADAADPAVAGFLLERYQPDVLALVAGAPPLLRRLAALSGSPGRRRHRRRWRPGYLKSRLLSAYQPARHRSG
jgi:NAD(P)-dependent dehydrogenase (short-subunit alcohol dehydrogenase family)